MNKIYKSVPMKSNIVDQIKATNECSAIYPANGEGVL